MVRINWKAPGGATFLTAETENFGNGIPGQDPPSYPVRANFSRLSVLNQAWAPGDTVGTLEAEIQFRPNEAESWVPMPGWESGDGAIFSLPNVQVRSDLAFFTAWADVQPFIDVGPLDSVRANGLVVLIRNVVVIGSIENKSFPHAFP